MTGRRNEKKKKITFILGRIKMKSENEREEYMERTREPDMKIVDKREKEREERVEGRFGESEREKESETEIKIERERDRAREGA